MGNPVESREEGEARRLPVQEEGKEVKAAVFTSSSFASFSFARFTNADGPKLSRLSDVFRLVLKIVIPTTNTKRRRSLFRFTIKVEVINCQFLSPASRHCFLLYIPSFQDQHFSIAYMIKKKFPFSVFKKKKKKKKKK